MSKQIKEQLIAIEKNEENKTIHCNEFIKTWMIKTNKYVYKKQK
jgi:hypothetical protein